MNKKFPWITAHTGCMGTPDNTMESALVGLQSGADFIEVDIRCTKDGVAFLAHDSVVKTESGKLINVYDLTLEELKALYKQNGIPHEVAVLDEVLDQVRFYDKKINLDLKGPMAANAMVKSVRKMNMKDWVVVSGCTFEIAYFFKNSYPELDLYLNTDKFSNISVFNERNCLNAISCGCFGINLDYHMCNPELIELARSQGLLVSVWTVNGEKEMKEMLEMGVDSITTRNVPALLELKKTKL